MILLIIDWLNSHDFVDGGKYNADQNPREPRVIISPTQLQRNGQRQEDGGDDPVKTVAGCEQAVAEKQGVSRRRNYRSDEPAASDTNDQRIQNNSRHRNLRVLPQTAIEPEEERAEQRQVVKQ